MAPKKIDYSKACIYKIVCKDPEVRDCYIGSTTNLVQRRKVHKSNCNINSRKQHNYYVYQFIRKNGGWENWELVKIKDYPCSNKEDLHSEERIYFEELSSKLNKNFPSRSRRERERQYYYENRNNRKEKLKQYSMNSRKKRQETKRQRVVCECGCEVSRGHMARHRRSAKHSNNITKN